MTEPVMDIPKRKLGKTGVETTILGLGGEGVLRTFGYETEARELINRAIDLGINYFDCARAYAGSELYYGQALKERRREIFLASKSHARDKEGALAHLHETLANMKTDYLDLWQIHDVRSVKDIERIFGYNGAAEAFDMAKRKGLVRFVGVTCHQDASLLLRCMERFDFDTALMPVNPCDSVHGNFLAAVLPAAKEKGIGVIGMKLYFKGLARNFPDRAPMEQLFRFALSHGIATAVIGCDSVPQLEENVAFARSFTPMTEEERADLVRQMKRYAGSLLNYKPQPQARPLWRRAARWGARLVGLR